jgi:glutamyl-tRNA synthetase/glutamyl-Q tRNA(Asp) synthetase
VTVSRFAPSTTGPAHPGTLLAALLCWLDARSRGARLLLRLEDLDPERCRPEWSRRMVEDLAWLGLDWDEVTEQHVFAARHAAALDRLAAAGRLYPCACSRRAVRALGLHAPDGGFRYPNTCRGRPLGKGGWRRADEPLRVRLPEGRIVPVDEGGLDLAQDPAAELGDPVVVRRDGAVAYLLATVLDDAASRVDRIVRGRDLAPLTATQVALQRLLGLPEPVYRHHLLLLEEREETAAGASARKLAKLHGAVGAEALRARYAAPELCGLLACAADLLPEPAAATPRSLLAGFAWERVARRDRVVRWTGAELVLPR